MKKIILLSVGVLLTLTSQAQQISDALRYSNDEIQGTARFRALSGAFGALGGDMSAVNINPAGSAVFNSSHASASASILTRHSETDFFSTEHAKTNTAIDFNQLGGAFVFKNSNENSPWKKIVLSAAYDKVDNFNNDWYAHGTNTNSIDQYFLSYAQGNRLDEISRFSGESYTDAYADIGYYYGYGNQQAFLGYESYILEPLDAVDENIAYSSNIGAGTFFQKYYHESSGYNSKVALNIATQLGNKLYLGANLNTHFIYYKQDTYFYENNSNPSSMVNEVAFDNSLRTTGSGFSFQVGAIFKPIEFLRIGASYSSPTWFLLQDETSQSIATNHNYNGSPETTVVAPNVVNFFEDYKIQSPGKITGSLAFVFAENGLISFDYSYRDYSNTRFKPTSDMYFRSLNSELSSSLTGASTYRIGGEYKIKMISLRAGYRMEESPYKNGETIGDLTGYSLGLGFNLGMVKLDLSYDNAQRKSNYQFFETGLTDPITLDSTSHNVVFTVCFNL